MPGLHGQAIAAGQAWSWSGRRSPRAWSGSGFGSAVADGLAVEKQLRNCPSRRFGTAPGRPARGGKREIAAEEPLAVRRCGRMRWRLLRIPDPGAPVEGQGVGSSRDAPSARRNRSTGPSGPRRPRGPSTNGPAGYRPTPCPGRPRGGPSRSTASATRAACRHRRCAWFRRTSRGRCPTGRPGRRPAFRACWRRGSGRRFGPRPGADRAFPSKAAVAPRRFPTDRRDIRSEGGLRWPGSRSGSSWETVPN